MRVLGVDCGSEKTGYGVIDSDGRDHSLCIAGVIRTSPKQPFEQRLLEKLQAKLVKAADTKEVRIGLNGITRKKP